MPIENPLLSPSTLPYGLPDYSVILPEHYLPAFEAAFAEHKKEVASITRVRSMPTFENTLVALETSGKLLGDVARTFYTVSSADATPEVQEIEETLAPLMSAHQDSIQLDAALYWRVKTVHDQLDELALEPEQRYLVERWYLEMTLAGAGLDDDAEGAPARAQSAAVDAHHEVREEPARRHQRARGRGRRRRRARRARPRASCRRRAEAAKARTSTASGSSPSCCPPATRTSPRSRAATIRARIIGGVALPRLARRRARQPRGAARDRPAARRAGRAARVTASTPVVTADETAGSPEAVRDMLGRLAPPAARNARREQAALQAIIDAGAQPFALEAPTGRSTPRRCAQAKYDVDTAALRPWFEAERVLQDGVFFAAERALRHHVHRARRPRRPTTPTRACSRSATQDGSPVGLYVLDLYTRDSKRGGAWMNSLVIAVATARHAAVVVNNLNVPKPAPGEPTLLTFDEVTTFFHEFGHALHGLFATGDLPEARRHRTCSATSSSSRARSTRCGCSGPRCSTTTRATTRPASRCPGESSSGSGPRRRSTRGSRPASTSPPRCSTRRGTRSRPSRRPAVTDVAAFEAKALAAVGLDNPAVPTRYSSTYFAHIFSGGYGAGLLLLHLERGARRRHRRVVQGERRPHPGERRPVPALRARCRRLEGPARRLPRVPRARRRHPAAPGAPRPRRPDASLPTAAIRAAAAARDPTPSFVRTLATCRCTVCGLRCSRPAICASVRPSAIRAMISRSRVVRSATASVLDSVPAPTRTSGRSTPRKRSIRSATSSASPYQGKCAEPSRGWKIAPENTIGEFATEPEPDGTIATPMQHERVRGHARGPRRRVEVDGPRREPIAAWSARRARRWRRATSSRCAAVASGRKSR